ncbi:Exocyst complex component 1 [Eumeta japonica]|uniref:Exocyst complex component 1 n=1 Tax=Eumeta variegata TaxID=151549 RepID=A0A4C1YZU6_EUMVA|nr:Exocyst complex component 1 [Eumeta japonica]
MARGRSQKADWKHIWTRDGQVLAQQADGTLMHRIRRELDLNRIFGVGAVENFSTACHTEEKGHDLQAHCKDTTVTSFVVSLGPDDAVFEGSVEEEEAIAEEAEREGLAALAHLEEQELGGGGGEAWVRRLGERAATLERLNVQGLLAAEAGGARLLQRLERGTELAEAAATRRERYEMALRATAEPVAARGAAAEASARRLLVELTSLAAWLDPPDLRAALDADCTTGCDWVVAALLFHRFRIRNFSFMQSLLNGSRHIHTLPVSTYRVTAGTNRYFGPRQAHVVSLATGDGRERALRAAEALRMVLEAVGSRPTYQLRLGAVQERLRRLSKARDQLGAVVARHLNNLLIHLGNEAWQESPAAWQAPPSRRHHTELVPYSPFMRWLRAMDERAYRGLAKVSASFFFQQKSKIDIRYSSGELPSVWTTASVRTVIDEQAYELPYSEPHRQLCRLVVVASDLHLIAVKPIRNIVNLLLPLALFFLEDHLYVYVGSWARVYEREARSLCDEARAHTQPADAASTAPALPASSSAAADVDALLDQVATRLEASCDAEQDFCTEFFCLENDGTAGGEGAAEARKLMSELFSAVEAELLALLAHVERHEPYGAMRALACLGRRVLGESGAGDARWSRALLAAAVVAAKRGADRVVSERLAALTDAGRPAARRPKCGVLPALHDFEELAAACESIFARGGRRADVERWYGALADGLLRAIAAVEHPRTPRAVVQLENYHRLHGLLSALRLPALDAARREARHRYNEALRVYVTQYFGRPLEKLNEFFEGVAEAVASGVRAEEVCYRAAFSKHELRRVLALYPRDEVRRALHRLYRTVEKHLSEEQGLLQVVWRAMQEEFIAQHKALEARLTACYAGAGLALPLSTQDILDAFSDIARSH